jgi:hypothetical protein
MQDQKLMEYFKFDEADVEANRNGQFTDKQKAVLIEENKNDNILRVIGGIVLLVIIAVVIYVCVSVFFQSTNMTGKFDTVFIGLIVVLMLGLFAVRTFRHAFAKFQVKLQRVEGPVNIVKEERSSTRTDGTTSHYYVYEMHVGDGTFQVNSDLAGIMMQGDTYAVYYTQGSENDILSAELISKAK